jgi:hypothetical protein
MAEGVGVALSFCPNAEVLVAARIREAASAEIKQLRVNVVGQSMPAPFSLFHFSLFTDHCMTIPPSGCRIDPV